MKRLEMKTQRTAQQAGAITALEVVAEDAEDKREYGNRGNERNLAGIGRIAIAQLVYQTLWVPRVGTVVCHVDHHLGIVAGRFPLLPCLLRSHMYMHRQDNDLLLGLVKERCIEIFESKLLHKLT